MDESKELEERLREAACTGDMDTLQKLVELKNVNINSQNSINGWTALHWAAKRNHTTVVPYLLSKGADRTLQTKDGDVAAQLTGSPEVRTQLGYEGTDTKQTSLPIQPNYLAYPVFPYGQKTDQELPVNSRPTHQVNSGVSIPPADDSNELVLKARVAYTDEKDFIEVELDRRRLTFEALVDLLISELHVQKQLIHKIRKLPNTIVRKDKDVQRLQDFQELEVVLSSRARSASSRGYGDISEGMKHEQILY